MVHEMFQSQFTVYHNINNVFPVLHKVVVRKVQSPLQTNKSWHLWCTIVLGFSITNIELTEWAEWVWGFDVLALSLSSVFRCLAEETEWRWRLVHKDQRVSWLVITWKDVALLQLLGNSALRVAKEHFFFVFVLPLFLAALLLFLSNRNGFFLFACHPCLTRP